MAETTSTSWQRKSSSLLQPPSSKGALVCADLHKTPALSAKGKEGADSQRGGSAEASTLKSLEPCEETFKEASLARSASSRGPFAVSGCLAGSPKTSEEGRLPSQVKKRSARAAALASGLLREAPFLNADRKSIIPERGPLTGEAKAFVETSSSKAPVSVSTPITPSQFYGIESAEPPFVFSLENASSAPALDDPVKASSERESFSSAASRTSPPPTTSSSPGSAPPKAADSRARSVSIDSRQMSDPEKRRLEALRRNGVRATLPQFWKGHPRGSC